jgi:zinc transport system substrate-binding protein
VLDPEQRPGAQRIAEIQARIRDLKVRCVFSEPQFQPALATTLVSGSAAQLGILDPLGAELPEGSDAYFQLLQGLADDLRNCLSDA